LANEVSADCRLYLVIALPRPVVRPPVPNFQSFVQKKDNDLNFDYDRLIQMLFRIVMAAWLAAIP
jgi:hypothetical protein